MYRGGIVAGVIMSAALPLGLAIEFGDPEDFPCASFLGWSVFVAGVLGGLRGVEQRWAERAPWRTAIACTLLAYLAGTIAVGQWHYSQAVSQGQVAAWQAAFEGLVELEGEGLLFLYLACQPLGAAVLFRQGKGDGSLMWANVCLVVFTYIVALVVVGLIEEWLWRMPLRLAEAEAGQHGAKCDEPTD
jgi:hypothetical protein